MAAVEFGSISSGGRDLDAHFLPLAGNVHLLVVHLQTRHNSHVNKLHHDREREGEREGGGEGERKGEREGGREVGR